MVELYLKKIKADDIVFTLEDVPKLWRQKVMDKLVEDGYTLNEDGSVVKEQVDFVGNLVLKRMFYGEWIQVYSPIYMKRAVRLYGSFLYGMEKYVLAD